MTRSVRVRLFAAQGIVRGRSRRTVTVIGLPLPNHGVELMDVCDLRSKVAHTPEGHHVVNLRQGIANPGRQDFPRS